jgi:hypothetical protein
MQSRSPLRLQDGSHINSAQIFMPSLFRIPFNIILPIYIHADRLCGLVLWVPGYRSTDPGSIPGATRFSE